MTADQKASFAVAEEILESLAGSNEPDTVLLAARAYLHLATVEERYEEPARDRLDALAEMTARPGVAGWGLSFDWDAFQDGTINPASTVYTYTTAAAALAFLDGYEVIGDHEYLEMAERAAHTIMSELCCWDDGTYASVWYSDQDVDQRDGMQIHNVSALSLAVFERLHRYDVEIDRGFTDRLARYLIALQGSGWDRPEEAAPTNWPYMVGRPVANDLLHETFIVEGLFWHREGQEAADWALSGIVETHYVEGRPRDTRHTQGSRQWGPPAGLYVLVGRPGYEDTVSSIAGVLREIEIADLHERARGWYGLALARHAAGENASNLIPTR